LVPFVSLVVVLAHRASEGQKTFMKASTQQIRIGILGVAVLAVSLAWFALHAASLLIVDAPERSDVILVLAGETDHRVERALELFDQGYGRQVVIDVPAAARVFGFTEVQLAQQYARQLPEGASVHICPIEGLSTRDESHDAGKCLSGVVGTRILIVTSDFHTGRALAIFQHELRGKSFSVAASYDAAQFGRHWWSNRQWAKTLLEEWTKIFWWNAVDRWRGTG
jgi:hypothetical protein